MKRYKLLKDLPYAKAGEVFERVTHKSEDSLSDYDYLEIKKRVKDGEDEVNFGIKYNYFLNNFDEWFEEIEEPTDSIHWKPKNGEKYWTPGAADIYSHIWRGDELDIGCYESGEVFRTEEGCKRARNRRLAEVRLRRTSTFKPDLNNGELGWVVGYSCLTKKLTTERFIYSYYGEIVCYKTAEDAKKSIKENREDWLIYFGVEEEEMKEFSIPVRITLDCCLSVKANNQDEAYEVADDTVYWACQNGALIQQKDLSILDYAAMLRGKYIDFGEWRDPLDTGKS